MGFELPQMSFASKVRPDHKGLDLLGYLQKRFTYHTPAEWQAHVEQGRVTLEGVVATGSEAVKPGDEVIYTVHGYTEPEVPTHYEHIWDDDEFLVVGKPAGAPIHSTGRIFYNTFTSVLRREFGNEELQPMHRLDRDTSGIMLFAKTRDTAARFQKNLDRMLLRKLYRVVVNGDFPDEMVECALPLREDPDGAIRDQMRHFEDGKPCLTRFHKQGVVRGPHGPLSVLIAELCTGRKHQIRAHLHALGYPVVGDRIYAHEGRYYLKMVQGPLDEEDYRVLGARHQMLHAWKVLLRLPYEKEPRWYESSCYTDEMAAVLADPGLPAPVVP